MRYSVQETEKKHGDIIREAARLFRERGFDRVTVAEVMQAAGLTHGAFYSHFESKEALVAAAVDAGMAETLSRIQKQSRTLAQQEAFKDSYLSKRHRDGVSGGCTMAALSTQLGNAPEARPAFTSKLQEIITALPGSRGDAILTMAAMVGALALSRAVDDPQLSEEILREVRARLDVRSSKEP